MRAVGFLLVLLSALLFSAQKITVEKRKAETLLSFCAMLDQLRGALESEAAPMPELMETLSGRCGGSAARFLSDLSASLDMLGTCSFRELWLRALRASPVGADREAVHALERLGGVLGRYELGVQLDTAASCQKTLCRRLDQTREKLPQTRRMTLGLSLSAAALLGIVLL